MSRNGLCGAGHVERHAVDSQRFQSPPQPQQLGRIHARSCARGVDELAVRRVVGQQQPREMRAGVMLPYTVGGMERASDLFGLFDDTVGRLVRGLPVGALPGR